MLYAPAQTYQACHGPGTGHTQSIHILIMPKRRQLQNISLLEGFPVAAQKRSCTDIFCLVLGLVFSLVMFILAAVLFNYRNFEEGNFPADSQGHLCGIDKLAYPYVYFANAPLIDRRLCVKQCPVKGSEALECVPTDDIGCRFSEDPKFKVSFYESEPVSTRSGHFCMPVDSGLRAQVLTNSQLTGRDGFYSSLDAIILCIFIAIGLSLLYLLVVQFFPHVMNLVAVVLGWLMILGATICLFLYKTDQTGTKLAVGLLLVLVLVAILFNSFRNMDSLRMHGIFLSYSTKMLRQRPGIFAYIPLFVVILLAFVVIIVLEFTSFWTSGELRFNAQDSLFHQLKGAGPIVLTVLLAIQAVWGLTFIKTAFNFCVSTETVNWYLHHHQSLCSPLKLLVCKHLGSVIGGSFMIGFFTILDFIYDFIKPDENANPNSACSSFFNQYCSFCNNLFDLIRTDSMAYMGLTGNPYCNSARYCEYLCHKSVIMDNSQSTSRSYRLCAHFLLGGAMVIFAMYFKGVISIYALLVVAMASVFICTFFISLHADATEAIQLMFLVEEELSRRDTLATGDNRVDEIERGLAGVKLREDLAEQVKQERIEQLVKNSIQNNDRQPRTGRF